MMKPGEEINGVRLLDSREISGCVLEQVVFSPEDPEKRKWFQPDLTRYEKRILDRSQDYSEADLAGLFTHIGAEALVKGNVCEVMKEVLDRHASRGHTNRVLLAFCSTKPESIKPVELNPVDLWFEPIPLNDISGTLPCREKSTEGVSKDISLDPPKRTPWYSKAVQSMMNLCGYSLLIVLLVLVLLTILTCAILVLISGFLVTMACVGVLSILVFMYWWFSLSKNETLVIPGAIVLRKTTSRKDRWSVSTLDRERCLLAIVVTADGPKTTTGVMALTRENGGLGLNYCFVEWRPLLDAWFSPLPTPKGDKLEDLR